MDWVPIVFIVFKVAVFGTGMFFAIFLGPLIGAALGEYIARRDLFKAGTVGLGTFMGFIAGVIAKIGCAFIIVLTVVMAHLLPWLQQLFQ